jgi:uncharacterized protein (UPF0332 family)
MKRTSKEEIIEYRINRSIESLKEAEKMFEFGFLPATVNRLYYSCFYIVTALLIKNGIEVKSHAGVRQMFGLHFILPGIISKTHGKFYGDLFVYRQDNDYRDFIIPDEKLITELLTQTNS